MNSFEPSYIRSYKEGLLNDLIDFFNKKIQKCTLCPHHCLTNRISSKDGKCQSGHLPFIASYGSHFGEESPLVGFYGSGTIFLSKCNLKCIFCQNYDISQMCSGKEISIPKLAHIMLELQHQGCHNINFVTPTHMVHAILSAIPIAIELGFNIPLVYNSGGYDSIESIKHLEGIFDIYMPDIKYFNNKDAYELSGISNYVEESNISIHEMHRQKGDLQTDTNGIAMKGLIIRHLILPNNIADSKKVIDFVYSISPNTYFNLMDQYKPEYKADHHARINRRITLEEYQEVYDYAIELGLKRLAN